jgi:DNA-binding transcriptional ArsR family regulator
MQTPSITQEVLTLHAEMCSALADPTRLVLLYKLSEHSWNVTELTQELNLSQPMISRHLKVLRERGLVTANRQGAVICYQLADNRIIQALDLLRSVMRDRVQYRASLLVLDNQF